MPFDPYQRRRPMILASTSATRRELLQRLSLDFDCISPDLDETPEPNEQAVCLARRLAFEKAAVIAHQYPEAWVIGADQVATLDGQCLNKPMTVDNAIEQLKRSSGRTVRFETAVSLQCLALEHIDTRVSPFSVTFRELTLAEIERYIEREEPLLCAGSFKCEGLGISLFAHLHGQDQTALMGLPLLALCHMLRDAGFQVP